MTRHVQLSHAQAVRHSAVMTSLGSASEPSPRDGGVTQPGDRELTLRLLSADSVPCEGYSHSAHFAVRFRTERGEVTRSWCRSHLDAHMVALLSWLESDPRPRD